MRYTIDGPDAKIDVLGLSGVEQTTVALLVHLPSASRRTAAMFGRHAAKVWKTQPKYAAFAFENGAHVVRWDGKVLNLTAESLKEASVGVLRSRRAVAEISAMGRWWTVDTEYQPISKEAILAAEGAG
jgi:hypothetical protein